MASTYPHYPFFWAAYGVTAVIYIAYGFSLYRRYAKARLAGGIGRVDSDRASR